MKKYKNIILGLILIAIGVVWGLVALDIFQFEIFFDGWWTLFIIIPCFVNIFTETEKMPSIIGTLVGVMLLLACQDIISFDILYKLIWPFILVIVGISLLFKTTANQKFIEKTKGLKQDSQNCCATFGGQEMNVTDNFEGTNLDAIFGGIDCHLEKALIKHDVLIKATAVFGGIDLFVPDDVNVVISSTSIFGGVDNKKISEKAHKKTIYVKALCLFGGVDIK